MMNPLPKHVAIIMDGNGRWAAKHHLPRAEGHRRGAEALVNLAKSARDLKIEDLTVYAFSTENWNRSREEVDALMHLLDDFLSKRLKDLLGNDLRLTAIGDLEMLPESTRGHLCEAMEKTAGNRRGTLNLALSYGSRREIAQAARRMAEAVQAGELKAEEIGDETLRKYLYAPELPDPELLIRTGGESRLSNFLLWQAAYSEFYVTPTLWPDFDRAQFDLALSYYQTRDRRFGGRHEERH
ncbi:MAG: isoprenyl transferase [Victivallaceae bacterium]|nr:isoprenyl transferase [Victivallaceae bacterium]